MEISGAPRLHASRDNHRKRFVRSSYPELQIEASYWQLGRGPAIQHLLQNAASRKALRFLNLDSKTYIFGINKLLIPVLLNRWIQGHLNSLDLGAPGRGMFTCHSRGHAFHKFTSSIAYESLQIVIVLHMPPDCRSRHCR